MDSNSLDLIVDSGGTDTTYASFGAVTSVGDVANEHISMSSAGMTVKDGGTTRASFGSDITMQGGTITLNGTTGTVGHDKLVIGSADIALYTNNNKKVHINDDGMNIGPSANAGNAVIGNVRLGSTGAYIYGAATDDYVFVNKSIPKKYKMIGNAVPCMLSYHIAKAIKNQYFS